MNKFELIDEIKNFSFKLLDLRTVPILPLENKLNFFSPSNLSKKEIINLTELYNKKKFKFLIEESNLLLKRYKNSPLLFNFIGAGYQALDNFEEARKSYLFALKIKPNFAEANFNIGVVLNKLNKSNESIFYFSRAIHENQKFFEAFFYCGILYDKLKNKKLSMEYYYKTLQLKPDHINASINLGNKLVEIGSYEDALKVYRYALILDDKNEKLLYNLANLLYRLEIFDEAILHYKSLLKLNKNHKSADHIKNSIDGKKVKKAPKEYVLNLFNKYANNFEYDLVEKLEYKAPTKLFEIFQESLFNKKYFFRGIDIGCGTGLSGEAFSSSVQDLYGLDLSNVMIEEAKKKNIYKKIFEEDALVFFKKNNFKYDLFVATDVFIYIGFLNDLFEQIKNNALKDAIFCFCTEHLEKGEFFLNKSGRFSHSFEYIKKLCDKNDFEIVNFKKKKLRKEKNKWIEGGYFIVKIL